MKERVIKIDKKINTIMEQTGLTRPTINKFMKGDINSISVGVLKKLCASTNTNVFIYADIEDQNDPACNSIEI